MHLLHDDCEPSLDAARLPLGNEALWVLDWLALRGSRVRRGEGVPHGRGEPVVVVPGFLGSYRRMGELTRWLNRIGYHAFDPGFDLNIECPDVLLAHLERQIARVHHAEGRRVRLIGHSLGGSRARAAAIRRPEHVSHVVTLGAPLRSVRAHALVIELARILAAVSPSRHVAHTAHEHGSTCACELAETLALPFPPNVSRSAIFSRRDGVVDWRACIEGDNAVDIEVAATHVGMIVHPETYRAIAGALAARPQPARVRTERAVA
jgi:pimeloyl-ACP methyl ester carboxylesterase